MRLLLGGSGPCAAVQPLYFGTDGIAQRLLTRGLGIQKYFPVFKKFTVIAGTAEMTAGIHSVQFDNAAAYFFEETPVVRNYEERKFNPVHEIFQPDNTLKVEMVSRLVQQQQIRLAQHLSQNRQPFSPTAGKTAGFCRQILKTGALRSGCRARLYLVFFQSHIRQRGKQRLPYSYAGSDFLRACALGKISYPQTAAYGYFAGILLFRAG